MKKILTMLAVFIVAIGELYAQDTIVKDTTWKSGTVLSLSFTQVSFSNWAAGGVNSTSGVASITAFRNYAKDRNAWDNNIVLAYGVIKNGKQDLFKNEDRIEVNSKYGYDLNWNNWYGTGFLSFRSQFDKGYANPGDEQIISDFLAPAYVTGGFGFDYKPNDNFSALIAPLTAKITIVNDDFLAAQGAYGVDAGEIDTTGTIILEDGEKIRAEFGGIVTLQYKGKLMENINFSSKVDLFSNYTEDPDHIDINAEALITAQINKFLNVSFGANLIYDHDIKIQEFNSEGLPKLDDMGNPIIGPRTQLKTVFGVAFNYRF